MKCSWLVVFGALICFGTQAYAQVITSDFASNADGWTSDGLAPGVTYTATGGNPNGYISSQTPGSIILGATRLWFPYYFYAPGKFEGNRSAYYGGGITYDISQTTTGPAVQYAAAFMANASGTTLYYYPTTPFQPPSFGTWTTFTISLTAATGEWKTTDSPTGTSATAAQIQTVLTGLSDFRLQGLYSNANVVTRIDNINMRPPITITTQPVAATVCEGLTATFTTLGTNNPNITYQWQIYNPFNGMVTNLTNTGPYSGTTTVNLSVNTTGNVGGGVYYRARISGTGVPDVYTTAVFLTVNPRPAPPTTTGAANCGPFAPKLDAAGAASGQYRWYNVATGGTSLNSGNSYSPGTITTTTNYWVAINNGTCESTRTIVTATVNTPPAAPTVTNGSRCGTGAVTLTAAGGAAGQYRWWTVATAGTAISGQTAATYAPTVTGTTNYWVSIDNGTCESNRTMVTAIVNTPPTAPATTGNSRCGTGTVTLNATGGTAGQYRWYTVATGGIAITGQTNPAYTPTVTATTNFWVEINNGTCTSTRTIVTATVNTPPTAPTTTGNSRCGAGSITVSAAGGTAGQYRWYSVATGGAAITGQTNATFTTTVSITTNFYVSIFNGTCESTRTPVVATVNTIPLAPTTVGASGCSPGSVTLTANGASNGQYRWYTVATGGTAIPGQQNTTFTTPVLSGNATYYVSVNNGTCEGPRNTVVATINNPPAPPATTGATICENTAAVLSASGAAAGQYRWYDVATGGTAIAGAVNDTFETPTLTASTTYYVSINDGCESARSSVDATVITAPPTPTATVNGESSSCVQKSFQLIATGGSNGDYRWYTVATGGTPDQNVSGSFTTPVVSATTTFYLALANQTCESTRVPVTVTIGGQQCTNNSAPVIETSKETTIIGGEVSFDLEDLITDADNNVELSTLTIVTQPKSGAVATYDEQTNRLVINYQGRSFTGLDEITIRVCDSFGACSEQTLTIDVTANITVYNAVSPNKDGKNDVFFIEYIDLLDNTKDNRVTIFNRWGDLVWEGKNYNNTTVVFSGLSKNNTDLPSGTYFYKLEFKNSTETGYLELKR